MAEIKNKKVEVKNKEAEDKKVQIRNICGATLTHGTELVKEGAVEIEAGKTVLVGEALAKELLATGYCKKVVLEEI